MKTAKNLITLLILVILSVQINAHELNSLEISVVLHDNGDASITEMRSAIVDGQGTEGYIKVYNLGKTMQVTQFSVSDEYSGEFIFQGQWDSKLKDREFKKGKCGIIETNNGVELCWGIGDTGTHHYKISYTVTNLVQSYADCDGFNHNFYEADNIGAKNAIITIIKENGSFLKDDVNKLTYFGSNGSINLINSIIVAESKSLDDGDKMILKCQFKKNVFHPVVKHNKSFKSFFFFKQFLRIIYFTLSFLFLPIIIVIMEIIKIRRYKKWFGVYRPDSPKISTEIPFNGDLQLFFGYLKAIDDSQAKVENKIAAFIVRMINNGDIELLEDGDKKVRIINPPDTELPSSVKNSYENVYHCLLSILWANSNEENIVDLNMVEINPFEDDKYSDRESYNKFEEYFNIISECPTIKRSTITPQEAISIMGLKKYLQEVPIDYEQSTMTNGISSAEYLVYESLFGMKKHSKLNFLDVAFALSHVWKIFYDSRTDTYDSGGSGGSSGGGGSGFR